MKLKLFRNMSKIDLVNWKRGAILGFYTYMLLLFINYFYSLIAGIEPFTSGFIFGTGLIIAFGYEFFLNVNSKMKAKK